MGQPVRPMSPLDALLGSGVAGVGAALQATIGFGSNLVAAPLLLLIDPRFVPGPVIVTSLFLNLLVTRREPSDAVHRGIRVAAPAQVVGILAAGVVLARVAAGTLSILFGALVLVAVVLSASGWHLRPTRRTLVGAGLAAGFMGTISGIGGPPIALVYQAEDGPTLRATLARFFLAGGLVSIPTLIVAGAYDRDAVLPTLALLPGTWLGVLASGGLRRHLGGRPIRPFVLALSAMSAVAVLVRELL